MHKSTIILAGICLSLAAVTGFSVWLLATHESERPSTPLAGGASINLGLPGLGEPDGKERVFTAGSALLYDTTSNTILFEQNAFERKPIASITKLMTAIVALDMGIDWDAPATIQPEEYVQGGRLLLHPGETVTMRDLFNASLLGSANNATLAYVRELGVPKDEFLREMNRKAIELGLEQTEFADVTGLDTGNVSTAYEVARIAQVAFDQYPEIAAATSQQEYVFVVGETRREHTIRNTNKLVSQWDEQVSGSKTGYLYEARYCLVVQGTGEQAGRIAVILDSPSEVEHFADIRKLLYMHTQ
ncbi:MAG: serine hydrolase [Candidatus Andersenbacteria bacterium]